MSSRELFRLYKDGEILEQANCVVNPIVEKLIYEGDDIVIHADPKIGKSLFLQQLACCLSSGTTFLGEFNIPKPVIVISNGKEIGKGVVNGVEL